jgi:tetratricopeptide (TPR) repeat protein
VARALEGQSITPATRVEHAYHLVQGGEAGDRWADVEAVLETLRRAGAFEQLLKLLDSLIRRQLEPARRVDVVCRLSQAHRQLGRPPAPGLLNEALAAATTPEQKAAVWLELAALSVAKGDHEAAQMWLERARGGLGGSRTALAAAVVQELALLLADRSEAKQLLNECIQTTRETLGAFHPALARLHHALGTVLARDGEVESAIHHLRLAEGVQRAGEAPEEDRILTLANLAAVLFEARGDDRARASEALGHAKLAVAMAYRVYSDAHAVTAEVVARLAQLQHHAGMPEAPDTATRALQLLRLVFGREHSRFREWRDLLEPAGGVV